MSSIFVYASVVGFLVGVAVRSLMVVSLWVYILCGVLVCIALLIFWLNRKKSWVLVGLFCWALLLGLIRTQYAFAESASFLDTQIGQTTIEGVVIDEPAFSEKSQKVVVEVAHDTKKEKVLLITSLYPDFVYGDALRASGVLKTPEAFMTDTGTMFDYASYLAKEGIAHQMLYPKVETISRGGGNFLYKVLFSLRRTFIKTLHDHLPEPQATLAGGISIGAQDGMDKETSDMFRRVGLIHIVVLSGYNITVVADGVMRMLAFLPRSLMLSGGALVVVLFTIMTGASATAVRASIMALIAILARVLGEKYDISRALALAAGGMVAFNPRILLFDPSFQLSFLATFGLIHLSPILERMFVRLPTVFALRQTVASTLATQTFVVPMLVWKTGQVSLISLLANVLVLPSIPIAMFFSGVLGVIGSFVPILGVVLSFPTTFFLSYVVGVARVLSKIPFASVEVGVPSAMVVGGVYVVLLLWIWMTKSSKHKTQISKKF
ncbi:ComEC family competence protein [Candidatus Campbellbacteria bacterium]|nr:MAG: ComEC family competence protein [Candidatus Campbellbacteria bacterium]